MATRQDDRGDEIGGGSEPASYHILPHTEEMANYLAHQQQQQQHQHQNFLLHQQHGQAPPGPMMWTQPPPHLGGPYPPHLQQQQPQPQPPPQPPHVYNEYLYNLAYSGQPGQPETYSVLPVGHGNFLKVYHCPENPVNDGTAPHFTHINMASLNHQHPHHQGPPPTPPQPTPLYELFAAGPLLPKPEMNIIGAAATQPQPSQLQPQPQPTHTNPQPPPPPPPQVLHPPSSANLLINNLVNNWSPNLTGGSYIQFGDEINENAASQMDQPQPPAHHQQQSQATQQQPQQQPKHQPQKEQLSKPVSPLPTNEKTAKSLKVLPLATESISPTGSINKSTIVVSGQPDGKKRIVAEVKPMPMSYSDVLSKGTQSSGASGETRAANGLDYGSQQQQQQLRRQGKEEGVGGRELRTAKRSPLHDAKDTPLVLASNAGHAHGNRGKKRGQSNHAGQLKQQQQPQIQPQTQPQQAATLQPAQIKSNKATNQQEKKRPLQPRSNVRANEQRTTASSIPASNDNGNGSAQNHTNNSNSTTNPAINPGLSSRKPSSNSSKGNANANQSNSTASTTPNSGSSSSNSNNNTNNNNIGSSSSKRYSSSNTNLNSNNSAGYSYSSKRNRSNAAYSSSNSPSHASSLSSNRNYELAKRILHTWWIYTLKLLTWLFYLVYDIVVLGFSMAYDRLAVAYVAGLAYARQLHKELKQNSGKPSIWWRNYWRRFDARFAKTSRWAFWRRFYKRKPPEPTSESFKTGRLPQTGEEAMYSLLNCKGKDAYSILGVPPDSSQEQIRKHYKKIAVLVHPDKNKQAGAEEAFKVLQRAFELIGEPENRLLYDQSIAETLHAEKAWTELHDLLSQLQTKMAEAANTIRCSTCAQRHPRKLTERPHYAARECASCKIRHSAKDGDIWAETSMMGLRWKYLALMDGKVYDITEWANCQKGALSHLEPNSHMVQYRIVRGAQQQPPSQQPQPHHHPQQQQQHPHSHPHHDRGAHHPGVGVSGVSEATLHEFLDNLYSGQHPGAHNAFAGNARRRARRN
ncbi:transcription factor SFL2 [Drosophila guanche]|uniref:Blast:DnaJ homolog subfamily C member 14 n=1 Tax=Drosophila guanche TaxID=7266 RepID=A0A3B0K210_DROGU|nr:transcription factor SFL2 [Drosophila guanche]SPP88264.1 blast:DnaJ homolog subfamily C member 14 [Drosophila guanche]